MKVSEHFNRSEFACKCGCGFAVADIELVAVLEDVRTHFDSPVIINSACRCEKHNKSVGGASGSKHKLGIAADIVVKDIHPTKVYEYLDSKYPSDHGVGKYSSFTHVDVRGDKARWVG